MERGVRGSVRFEADKARLFRGLDPIAYTLTRTDAIHAFERKCFETHPWVAPPLAPVRADKAG